MSRSTLRVLQGLLATHRVSVPGFVPTVLARAVGTDKSLRLAADVTVNAGPAITICGDSGKVKTYSDLDSIVRAMSKIAESSNGVYSLTVDTGALFASSVPTDIIASYEAQVIRLGKTKTSQQAVSAALAASLALMVGWDTGNAAQVARFNEVTAQKAAVDADIAAIDAEVARLNALINP